MPLRRRAPKACHACRDRKVKCDVSTRGIPCQNCVRMKADCSILARKKRASKRSRRQDALPIGMHIFEVGDVVLDQPRNSSAPAGGLTGHGDADINWPGRSPEALVPAHGDGGSPDNLPGYITPLRLDLDLEVLRLLQRKRALSLPLQTTREEMIRAYVCYVHPFLPLLDLEHFIAAIDDEYGDKKVSLVLYQAVMFAASAFVDVRHVTAEGFHSRKEARRSYFERVRLLFDSDVELEPITLVQVLLLMTYWYDTPADIKGRSHWVGIAFSFANDIGLGQQSELAMLTPSEQKHRRRLWYCCLMRDKLISLSELRPESMFIEEADYPSLFRDDFECPAFACALERFSGDNDGKQWGILTHLCFEKVKLCIIISRILRTQYDSKRPLNSFLVGSTISLAPDQSPSAVAEFVARDQEARKWSLDMCPITSNLVTEELWRSSTTVSVHCTSVELLYYTVLGLVHRPRLLTQPVRDSAAEAIQDFSRKILRDSALRITQLSKVFLDADRLCFLPPIGVTALLSAALQHTKDIESSSPEIRRAAEQNRHQTLQSLAGLQDMYFSADHAMTFIEIISNKTRAESGPDLKQLTVFPLFRDELSAEARRRDANSTGAYASHGYPQVDLASPQGLHASMDVALINSRGTDDVDIDRLLNITSASAGHHPSYFDSMEDGTAI